MVLVNPSASQTRGLALDSKAWENPYKIIYTSQQTAMYLQVTFTIASNNKLNVKIQNI